MSICPVIETERLLLRPFRETDVGAYLRVIDAPPVRRSHRTTGPVTAYDAWSQMAMFLGQWELRGSGQWAVEVRETGELIGRAGGHWPPREGWPGLEIGWTLHPDHWGHGFATEAGRASVEWAFENHDVEQLYSTILVDNHASQAVAGRLGFVWTEDRVLPHFPGEPHGIWALARTAMTPIASPR